MANTKTRPNTSSRALHLRSVGGAVAALGLAGSLWAAYLWMIRPAAAREKIAACRGLEPSLTNKALCPNGACQFPMAAPEFTVKDHAGNDVKLSSFRGRTVLLNFWASWCETCKAEKPALEIMAADLGAVEVVALASDNTWAPVLVSLVRALAPLAEDAGAKKLADYALGEASAMFGARLRQGTAFKVLLDPPGEGSNLGQVAKAWGVTAVPESFLIDAEGRIQYYFVNKRDWSSAVAATCLRGVADR